MQLQLTTPPLQTPTTNLQRWETDANEEIRYPIDEHRNRHGGWAGPLREQLGSDHPRDGAGPEGEEHDEAERGDDGQVRHPVNHLLHIAEELLLGRRVVFAPSRLLARARSVRDNQRKPYLKE